MSMESGNLFALVEVLTRHDIQFVIIGGFAVSYYGYVRATEDIDIIYKRTAASETGLLRALTELEAFWIGNEIDPTTGLEKTHPVTEAYIANSHLMMIGTKLGYLDLFDFVPGLPAARVDDLLASAETSSGCPFVTLKWLKEMKQASGRPQDLLDLSRLP